LTTEIDRVAETTKFNETYLLKGDTGTKTINLNYHDAGLKGTMVDNGDGTAVFTMDALSAGDSVSIGGKEYTIGGVGADVTAMLGASGANIDTNHNDVTVNGTTYKYYSAIAACTTTGTQGTDAGWYSTDPAGLDNTTAAVTAQVTNAAAFAGKSGTISVGTQSVYVMTDNNSDGVDDNDKTIISAKKAYTLAQDELLKANQIGDTEGNAKVGTKAAPTTAMTLANATNEFGIQVGKAKVANTLSFNLHVGADADMTNKINVNIETMNSTYLGIKDLDVVGDGNDGGSAATYAIDAIADAISKVSSQRSALGAVQNRLEHTIANLDNVVENTTSAESRIRDTDMAEEMVEYSKNNILAQAGQSMLAQANQSTQGVLSLLQ
jgi:flagellin